VPGAEHIERQIPVTIIITVKEPSLLMAMQGVVSRVEIENDLLSRSRVRLQEQLNEQPLNPLRIVTDFMVARR